MDEEQRSIVESTVSKYHVLHERGLHLEDSEIDFVTVNLLAGMKDAVEYLQAEAPKIGFISDDNQQSIGYVPDKDVFNVPMQFLKSLEEVGSLSDYVLPIGVMGYETHRLSFKDWLRNVGRQEMIHRFQYKGHPKLKAKPHADQFKLSQFNDRLSDVEVEAHAIADKIAVRKGEQPVWREYLTKLKELYPDRFNKSASELLVLRREEQDMSREAYGL